MKKPQNKQDIIINIIERWKEKTYITKSKNPTILGLVNRVKQLNNLKQDLEVLLKNNMENYVELETHVWDQYEVKGCKSDEIAYIEVYIPKCNPAYMENEKHTQKNLTIDEAVEIINSDIERFNKMIEKLKEKPTK